MRYLPLLLALLALSCSKPPDRPPPPRVDLRPGNSNEYIVGVEDLQYSPLCSWDDGHYNGVSYEILQAFARERGYRFIYRAYPVRRLYENLLNGSIDFKYPDRPEWQSDIKNKAAITYSSPVVGYIDGVMVLPVNRRLSLTGLKTLGTVSGFTPSDYLDPIRDGRIKLEENPTLTGLLQQVVMGKVGGAYCNVVVAEYHLSGRMNRPGALVWNPDLPHTRSAYLLSSLHYPVIIRQFDQFLSDHASQVQALKSMYNLRESEAAKK